MNKRMMLLILSLLMIISFVACSQEEAVQISKERLVETQTVEVTKLPESIYYVGFIEPSEIKSYALKTSGLVNEVKVKSGDRIVTGDLLVSLDSYEYNLGVKASSEQLVLSELELQKVIEARDFYEKTYKDSLELFNKGIISSQKLDEIKLQYDIKSKEVEQASKVKNQAQIDSELKNSTLSDTALFADMNGYVVDVLNKAGEIVSQGYPLVIARSEENVVKVGMSQNDIKRIELGHEASVLVNDQYYTGMINNINLMPDKLSKTYTVEILLEEGDFLIGESCKVFIDLDEIEGIWLNITDIMNDGVDYVFIVLDERATRKDIELHEINGSLVRVTNLKEGDQIITSGTNALAEGYKVKIEGDLNE